MSLYLRAWWNKGGVRVNDQMWYTKIDKVKEGPIGSILVQWQALGVKINFKQYVGFDGEVGRLYSCFRTYVELWNYIQKIPVASRCFHECVIGDSYQKVYFDLDVEGEGVARGPAILADLKSALLTTLNSLDMDATDDNIIVYSSHDETKYSCHIVTKDICVISSVENAEICRRVIAFMEKNNSVYVDKKVYSSMHGLRLYGCHKPFSKRTKLRENTLPRLLDEFKLSLVGMTFNCRAVATLVPKLRDRSAGIEIEEGSSEDIMAKVIEKYGDAFEYRKQEENIIYLDRKYPTYCVVCDDIHHKENPRIVIRDSGDVMFKCMRADYGTLLMTGSIEEIDEEEIKEDISGIPDVDLRFKVRDVVVHEEEKVKKTRFVIGTITEKHSVILEEYMNETIEDLDLGDIIDISQIPVEAVSTDVVYDIGAKPILKYQVPTNQPSDNRQHQPLTVNRTQYQDNTNVQNSTNHQPVTDYSTKKNFVRKPRREHTVNLSRWCSDNIPEKQERSKEPLKLPGGGKLKFKKLIRKSDRFIPINPMS